MTLPQEALAAPGSDPRDASQTQATSFDLIRPPDELFDRARIDARLEDTLKATKDHAQIRARIVELLGDEYQRGRAVIETAFAKRPRQARDVIESYTYLTDCVVTTALDLTIRHLHPNPVPTRGDKIALLAVGGYGRGEMAPYSDVDLLFLAPTKLTPWCETVIETVLYTLWDLRLKVGHASRTVKECVRMGREDYTIRTALLEHRHLAGNRKLSQTLTKTLRDELFQGTASDFVEAKLAERASRHQKQGDRRFMLEPNVKEGKGGLRDLQSLFWIAKYVHQVSTKKELVALGVFSKEELRVFETAENFLWAVRCNLHLCAGRPMEQLTFDQQIAVAARMGYKDDAARRGVEHFMQDYFRHATKVGDLTRIFLTALEESHVKRAPKLSGLLRRRRKVKDGYKIIHNRLAIADETTFFQDPLNILRLFDEGLRTGALIHPDAMRAVAANLKLIDAKFRADKQAQKIFMGLLLNHANPERALRRMNELGVLAAFIPEFEPIQAMMQFNVYHHYTVDEHTIQCLSVLAQIERAELQEALPIASRILEKGVNRKVIYVALLLHDIGKGRNEDHSILGARIARRVAPNLGLKKADCETVEWLVRNHLVMSDVAQKRDQSDPQTIRGFAKQVKSVERLNLLTLLTVCDIRGVGPHTWNNWKAQLLRSLYRETRSVLENGMEALNSSTREDAAKRELRAALPDWEAKDLRTETGRHYSVYWQSLPTEAHLVFARLLRKLDDDEIGIDLHPDQDRDATRACFALADHPGIFARLTGALALVGANVVDARTFTTKDGYATAAFWIQDANGKPYGDQHLPRLRRMIEKTLRGEILPKSKMADRDRVKKRESGFRFPTRVTFDNEGSEIHTIIEVDTRDRPGLLFDLARAMAHCNLYISSAVVATYGAQAVDVFYVKDMFGLKLLSDAKQKTIAERLTAAIERGAERARK